MSKIRCAIYTRKSSEEGLEQDFNSLDAQREACSAYILSQASEGWSNLGELYDDGGISGGTMKRPALRRLLGDIAAGKIDIVVVYKVDRLTRSLLDFSKLVEAMDKAEVSFVSVTQSFNTTTSMGRLTLNMLLSFAQFEREVTAERIRDKIAASKAKGMWMGGVVPLGYAADGRTLAICEEHAALILTIFKRYLEAGNVRLLSQLLEEERAFVPERVTGTGRRMGGRPFTRGQLYKILSNPIYNGQISHKQELYKGQHEAIINRKLWENVQQKLTSNTQGDRNAIGARSPSLLAGRVADAVGNPLIASHATKGKARYRYYINKPSNGGPKEAHSTLRIPALELEKVVCEGIVAEFRQPLGLIERAGLDLNTENVPQLIDRANRIAERIGKRERSIVRQLMEEVRIESAQVVVRLSAAVIAEKFGAKPVETAPSDPMVTISVTLKRSGRAVRLVQDGGTSGTQGEPQEHLLKLIHRARAWWKVMIDQGLTVSALAREQGVTSSYASRVVRLNFLAPEIIERIIAGNQPILLDAKRLLGLSDLPPSWKEQKKLLLIE